MFSFSQLSGIPGLKQVDENALVFHQKSGQIGRKTVELRSKNKPTKGSTAPKIAFEGNLLPNEDINFSRLTVPKNPLPPKKPGLKPIPSVAATDNSGEVKNPTDDTYGDNTQRLFTTDDPSTYNLANLAKKKDHVNGKPRRDITLASSGGVDIFSNSGRAPVLANATAPGITLTNNETKVVPFIGNDTKKFDDEDWEETKAFTDDADVDYVHENMVANEEGVFFSEEANDNADFLDDEEGGLLEALEDSDIDEDEKEELQHQLAGVREELGKISKTQVLYKRHIEKISNVEDEILSDNFDVGTITQVVKNQGLGKLIGKPFTKLDSSGKVVPGGKLVAVQFDKSGKRELAGKYEADEYARMFVPYDVGSGRTLVFLPVVAYNTKSKAASKTIAEVPKGREESDEPEEKGDEPEVHAWSGSESHNAAFSELKQGAEEELAELNEQVDRIEAAEEKKAEGKEAPLFKKKMSAADKRKLKSNLMQQAPQQQTTAADNFKKQLDSVKMNPEAKQKILAALQKRGDQRGNIGTPKKNSLVAGIKAGINKKKEQSASFINISQPAKEEPASMITIKEPPPREPASMITVKPLPSLEPQMSQLGKLEDIKEESESDIIISAKDKNIDKKVKRTVESLVDNVVAQLEAEGKIEKEDVSRRARETIQALISNAVNQSEGAKVQEQFAKALEVQRKKEADTEAAMEEKAEEQPVISSGLQEMIDAAIKQKGGETSQPQPTETKKDVESEEPETEETEEAEETEDLSEAFGLTDAGDVYASVNDQKTGYDLYTAWIETGNKHIDSYRNYDLQIVCWSDTDGPIYKQATSGQIDKIQAKEISFIGQAVQNTGITTAEGFRGKKIMLLPKVIAEDLVAKHDKFSGDKHKEATPKPKKQEKKIQAPKEVPKEEARKSERLKAKETVKGKEVKKSTPTKKAETAKKTTPTKKKKNK